MAMQTCPNCKTRNTTWHIDEEVSPFTQWFCKGCETTIFEDESKQTICARCGQKSLNFCWNEADSNKERTKIGDATFWWCCGCNIVRPTNENTVGE